MIDKDTITASREVELNRTRIRVAFRYGCERTLDASLEGIARGLGDVDGLEQQLKAQVWHGVYGDVAAKVDELKRNLARHLILEHHCGYLEQFKAIEAMLRNPFLPSTPETIK